MYDSGGVSMFPNIYSQVPQQSLRAELLPDTRMGLRAFLEHFSSPVELQLWNTMRDSIVSFCGQEVFSFAKGP